jgi:NAD dependent epimerase/dehydratase family enzyme
MGENGNFSRLGEALRKRRFIYPGRRDALKASGYVVDFVRSIEFMQRQDGPGTTYNFASEHTYTLEQICEAFSRVLGRRPPRLSLPAGWMLRAGTLGDRSKVLSGSLGLSQRRVEKLLSSTNVKADRLISTGFNFEYDLESALRHWYLQEPVGRFL